MRKLTREEAEQLQKYQDEEERREIPKKGVAAGTGIAVAGAGLAGASRLVRTPSLRSRGLKTGSAMAIGGGALAGYSAYRHHKNKKNDSEA